MAKIYGEIPSTGLMTFDKSFSRSNGQPLESTEIHYSLSSAQDYAKTNVAYAGQKIAVIETTDDVTTITHYSIEADGTLKQLGSVLVGDNLTVEVIDGEIKLAGINDDNSTGVYQPFLVDGKIEWRQPSDVTTDDLDDRLSTVENNLESLEAANTSNSDAITDINNKIGEVAEDKTIVEMIDDAKLAATYDDTALVNRVKTIEDDYIDSNKLSIAKQEVIDIILGENVNADFDTLQEVAAWIQSDTTNSTELINRVSAIENDYLKGADKTELTNMIDALGDFVGDLPENAVSSTVVEYIQEVINGLNINDYAKASELTSLAGRVTALETKAKSVDDNIVALQTDKADKGTTLAEYGISDAYTKTETENRIQEVLDGLSDTSETAASVAQQLEAYKTSNNQRVTNIETKDTAQDESIVALQNKVTTLESDNETNKNNIQSNADAITEYKNTTDNALSEIDEKIVALQTTAEKVKNASNTEYGLVIGSGQTGVNIEDGEIKSISTDLLVNGSDTLILQGGAGIFD